MTRVPPMRQITLALEFDGLIRQELDIEALLRRTLEFVLARCGATNAAVFLPTTAGDYSLGAYVNYDCPKDTADVLLDHLANTAAPRIAELPSPLHLTDPQGVARTLGDDAGWLGDSHALALPCRHEGETLAAVLLFRDKRTPYTGTTIQQMRTVSDLFAAQLSRVIRIHHRHLPKDKWGALGDPDHGRDDDSLAA